MNEGLRKEIEALGRDAATKIQERDAKIATLEKTLAEAGQEEAPKGQWALRTIAEFYRDYLMTQPASGQAAELLENYRKRVVVSHGLDAVLVKNEQKSKEK